MDEDLITLARAVIGTNQYMTLGTTDPDGRPRVSPVYFTHADFTDYYWVSSPRAHHSENVAARPAVAIVIFDSTAPIGEGQAVYITADAAVVPDADLPQECARAFAHVSPGAHAFEPAEVSGVVDLRLYRARATRHEVHIRGRDPVYGRGVDTRRAVGLGG